MIVASVFGARRKDASAKSESARQTLSESFGGGNHVTTRFTCALRNRRSCRIDGGCGSRGGTNRSARGFHRQWRPGRNRGDGTPQGRARTVGSTRDYGFQP